MNDTPLVSILIPAYNSSTCIGGCLASLATQSYRNFEVIIVNSSPEPATREVVQKTLPESIFIQHPERLLPQDAKGVAITHAKGELLAFIDPDCRADPNWLETLVDTCNSGKAFVGGSMRNHRKTWKETGIHIAKFHDQLPGVKAGPIWILPFSNSCIRSKTWERVGPFKPNLFCSDGLISFTARKAGITPWFEPNAIVEHIHDMTMFGLVGERFYRGFEFIQERILFESWSRTRLFTVAVLAPIFLLFVLGKSAKNALVSRMGIAFFITLPVQLLAQASWVLGESFGCMRLLVHQTFKLGDRA